MQKISPVESRKILDAMNIPVVLLRDRCVSTKSSALIHRPSSVENAELTLPQAEQLIDSSGNDDSLVAKTRVNNETQNSDDNKKKFSLVSIVSSEVLLACELPEWAGGMLEGRLTRLCSDLMRALSGSLAPSSQDWQYFHWPIKGIKDHSEAASLQALDAWLHRRWAETNAVEPLIVLSISQVDLSEIFSDAIFLPTIEQLIVSSTAKRDAWEVIRARVYG